LHCVKEKIPKKRVFLVTRGIQLPCLKENKKAKRKKKKVRKAVSFPKNGAKEISSLQDVIKPD